MRPATNTLVAALLLLMRATTALDVEIEKVECVADYPVQATVFMGCSGGTSEQGRCTFGEPIRVYGELVFSGVQNSGITNDIAYLSASLSLFSIDFDLVNKQVVPLCYEYDEEQYGDADQGQEGQGEQGGEQQDGNQDEQQNADQDANQDANQNADQNGGRRLDQGNQCPADGSYAYSVKYVLPSAGSESAAWLASGWTGTGILEMFAQRNDAMKIGECHLTLSTYVTKKDGEGLVGRPSAAATTGIVLAVAFAAMLTCCYCYCCIRSRQAKKNELEPGDDITSNFRRMDTSDEHSKPPTISLDAASMAQSKRSAKEMV